MCVFLRYWSGLQKEEDKEAILEGADRIQGMALTTHEAAREGAIRARLEEIPRDDAEEEA